MAVGRATVELRHDHAFKSRHDWQAAFDANNGVAFLGWIEFEFELVLCDQIIGDGRIVSNQAIREIQVY